jgi:hypothetical protein
VSGQQPAGTKRKVKVCVPNGGADFAQLIEELGNKEREGSDEADNSQPQRGLAP